MNIYEYMNTMEYIYNITMEYITMESIKPYSRPKPYSAPNRLRVFLRTFSLLSAESKGSGKFK